MADEPLADDVNRRKSDEDEVFVYPSAVGMPLDGDGGHFDGFFGIGLIGFSEVGVQFWEQAEQLVVVIIEAFEDGFFHLSDILICIKIPVVMGGHVMVNTRREGILVWRAAVKQERDQQHSQRTGDRSQQGVP